MSDPYAPLPPNSILSTPDPTKVALYAGLVRDIIKALAGAGLAFGFMATISDAQISAFITLGFMLLSFITWLAATVYSWWQKRKAAQVLHDSVTISAEASAKASAEAGVPLPIVAIRQTGNRKRIGSSEAAPAVLRQPLLTRE